MRKEIDGTKYDIRVICSGATDSDDAGLVEGVPIDPPDNYPGWLLVDLWVEHDSVQEKGDKGAVVTRKVNAAYYQVWMRPKSPAKKTRAKKRRKAVVDSESARVLPDQFELGGNAVQPPKKKRGRKKKNAELLNEDPITELTSQDTELAEN